VTDSAEDQLVKRLEDTLEEYRSLLELLEDKQEILLDRDVDRLEEITEKEQQFVDELQRLESDRGELWDELLPEDVDRDEASIDRVLSHVSESIGEQLRDIRVELKKVVRDVRRINDENTLLLENRISVFDEIFEMITGDQDDNTTYGPDTETEQQSTQTPRLVDEAI
jgi:flagellar biosynthesis/type III secretory pathway chaperone